MWPQPRSTWSRQKPEEAREPPGGAWPCDTAPCHTLASRAPRVYIPVVLNHAVCGHVFQQPREADTDVHFLFLLLSWLPLPTPTGPPTPDPTISSQLQTPPHRCFPNTDFQASKLFPDTRKGPDLPGFLVVLWAAVPSWVPWETPIPVHASRPSLNILRILAYLESVGASTLGFHLSTVSAQSLYHHCRFSYVASH